MSEEMVQYEAPQAVTLFGSNDPGAIVAAATAVAEPLAKVIKDRKLFANIKGRQNPKFPLTFVRIEPYVIPKKSLTGDNTERVDTRALQVLYALPDHPPAKVYVGQQMEVFLSADDAEKAQTTNETAPVSLGNGG